jgi:hypothetical protein
LARRPRACILALVGLLDVPKSSRRDSENRAGKQRSNDVMKIPRLLPLALFAVWPLAVPARAELDVAVSAEIRLGKVPPPMPPAIEIVDDAARPKGPPPWAPAHGFRRNRGYYYYPGADVYYRPADRMWFFLDGGSWRLGAELPSSIRVDFERSVSLEMETDKPFEHHSKVASYYPSDYFAHVKIKGAKGKNKDRGEKPAREDGSIRKDDAGHSEPGSDHPSGKGKGNGKGKNK